MADMAAVKAALEQVLELVSGADTQSMLAARKPKAVSVEIEAEGGGKCPECEDGSCLKHASEEDLAGLGE